MTIILEKPDRPTQRSFAGGVASIADIAAASLDSLLFVENSGAAFDALERAYDDRARELAGVAGVKLENPVRAARQDFRMAAEAYQANLQAGKAQPDREAFGTFLARRQGQFDQGLAAAVGNIPDRTVADRLMRSVEGDAARLARETDERLARLMESRPGAGKWAALLAGGIVGSLADPITLMSLGAGAGPGAARTLAGRIFAVAGKEAVINAATEAFVQPAVQAWREKAGLPHGLGEAVRNVAFAGLAGGVLGGAGQGVAEVLSRSVARTRVARAVDELALREDAPAALRAVIEGEPVRAAEVLAPLRRDLSPELRGAVDAGERIAHADAVRPASVSAERHDIAVATADMAIRSDDAWRGFEPDPAQVARVAERIAGDSLAPPLSSSGTTSSLAGTPMALARFLADRGGVQDRTGELRQIGATEVAFRGRGRLVTKNGDPLDMAREAAAEAGYFDHLYGTPDEAVAKSTVNDLVEALDAEIRDSFAAGPAGRERQLAALEGAVHDVARLAGPALPDELLEAAARLSVDDGMEPGDALERVLVRAELNSDNTEPLLPVLDFEHASDSELEQFLEALRRRSSLSEGQRKQVDRAFHNFDLTPEIYDLIEKGAVPLDRPLTVFRGRDGDPTMIARSGRTNSATLRPAAAETFGGLGTPDEAIGRITIMPGTRVYSPDSGIKGGEIVFAADTFYKLADRDERGHWQIVARPRHSDDPPPGWSDAELWTAGNDRAGIPQSLDEVAAPETDADAAEIAAAEPDMLIPTDSGERSVKEVNDAIRRRNGLAGLVEGCGV